ncbi:NmrA-like protein [Mycena albidolilacea]|uniref:NmrA-like protein n=1 Tax=Mycena albidolilacea TaxID=1033008 RepID=A0AAD7AE10_9AGAR|nr:NmrA-like protein [Mycena albidolilacea]
MPIIQDPSAPLVAVIGATGAQGGSVVKALRVEPYRVRGFSRDSTKPATQKLVNQGVEVADVSLVLGNVKDVFKAFEGTKIAFISGGKYTHVVNFDSKTLVTDYGRQSGVPFVDVQAGQV